MSGTDVVTAVRKTLTTLTVKGIYYINKFIFEIAHIQCVVDTVVLVCFDDN